MLDGAFISQQVPSKNSDHPKDRRLLTYPFTGHSHSQPCLAPTGKPRQAFEQEVQLSSLILISGGNLANLLKFTFSYKHCVKLITVGAQNRTKIWFDSQRRWVQHKFKKPSCQGPFLSVCRAAGTNPPAHVVPRPRVPSCAGCPVPTHSPTQCCSTIPAVLWEMISRRCHLVSWSFAASTSSLCPLEGLGDMLVITAWWLCRKPRGFLREKNPWARLILYNHLSISEYRPLTYP